MDSWVTEETVLDTPHRDLLEYFSASPSFLELAQNYGIIVCPRRLASAVNFLFAATPREEEACYENDVKTLFAAFEGQNGLHKVHQLGEIRYKALNAPRFFHLVIPRLALLAGEDSVESDQLVPYFQNNFMDAFKVVFQNNMKGAGFTEPGRFEEWAKEIVFWAIYSRIIFGQHGFRPKKADLASEYMKPVIISKDPQSMNFEAMKPEAGAPWHPYHSYWQATQEVVDIFFEKMSFGSAL